MSYWLQSCFTCLQVRSELYTAANVAALNRIRIQLQTVRNYSCSRATGYSNDNYQALDQAKATLQRSEVQLRKYMDMGTGEAEFLHRPHFLLTLCSWFDGLVEEYTRLVEHLEDKQWTMKVAASLRFLFAFYCWLFSASRFQPLISQTTLSASSSGGFEVMLEQEVQAASAP